ncbi:MAG: hypothetical protein IPK78_20715 [Rhodospirillales bacterium]|nr:hypothetical protein [Rhodospirillales bacterium]
MRKIGLARAAAVGIAYAAFVLLVTTFFGPPPPSPEQAFPAAPQQWAEVMLHLNVLLAVGLGLIMGGAREITTGAARRRAAPRRPVAA